MEHLMRFNFIKILLEHFVTVIATAQAYKTSSNGRTFTSSFSITIQPILVFCCEI